MRSSDRRVRRRWRWILAVAVTLLALPVVAWLLLPTIVEQIVRRVASSAGGEAIAIQVERGGLSNLGAHDIAARFGRVTVELSRIDVHYDFRSVIRGGLKTVTLQGLDITIDATDLDQAELEAWLAGFGSDGTEPPGFPWPVERLEMQDAALILQLPDTTQRFPLAVSALRDDDGKVAFTMASDHPGQRLHLSGEIDPTSLSGTLRLDDAFVEPDLYRDLATRAGLLTIPPHVEVDADRIALQATMLLENGSPAAMTGELRLASMRGRRGTIGLEVSDVVLTTSRDQGELFDARLTGTVAASDPERGWYLSATDFSASLLDQRVTAEMSDATIVWNEQASAVANLTAAVNLTQNEDSPAVTGAIDLLGWEIKGRAGRPARIDLQGTVEELEFEIVELQAPGEVPLALRNVNGTITGITSDQLIVTTVGSLFALAGTREQLPAGWRVEGGDFPRPLGRVAAHMVSEEDAMQATVELDSAGSESLEIVTGRFRFQPSLHARIDSDGDSFEAKAALGGRAITFVDPETEMDLNAIELHLALPSVSVDSFVSLLSGENTEEDFTLTVNLKSLESATAIESVAHLQFAGGTQSWSATKELELTMPRGRIGGIGFTDAVVRQSSTVEDIDHAQLLRTFADQPFRLLARELFSNTTLALEWSAASLTLPGETQVQWASGTIAKQTSGSPELRSTALAGIVRSGPETLEQAGLEVSVSGANDTVDVKAEFSALLEGAPIKGTYADTMAIDWAALTVAGNGSFELAPYTFQNSDIISRWLPEFPGIALSGTVAATGTTAVLPNGQFDGTMVASLKGAVLSYPEMRVRISGIEGGIEFAALKELRTAPGQEFRFSKGQVRDLEIDRGYARFRLDGAKRLYVEETRVGIFDGTVSTGPFSLFFPNPDVAVVFGIASIDAGQLARRFDLFDGTITGRLSGRLPLALLAGRPLIGQGFLALDPDYPATLQIDADGLFTGDLPTGGIRNRLNRLGYELAEEGLENLSIKTMYIDLFHPDLPGTPVRIELSGEADTPRANVPMNIVTNVNGSVTEVLDLVLQFLMH